MKRWVIGLSTAVLLAAVIGYRWRGPLALVIMERVVARNMGSSLLDELPPGLHVALCGAGSPMPDPERSGPCVAVIAGGDLYVIDAGAGSSRVLSRLRLPQGRVQAIFLTHFHSDHIDGLGEIMLQRWAGGGNGAPVPVFGPTGVDQVVEGFNRAYAQDVVYRVAHHGEAVVPRSGAGGVARPFTVPQPAETRLVLEHAGLKVTAFRVDHEPVEPAVGYRFDYAGRSVVVSGDTTKSANLQRFAERVDLLVHEALAPHLVAVIERSAASAGDTRIEKIMADIPSYHATPVEVAEIARDAGVGHLLYYHIVPPLPLAALREVFLAGVEDVFAPVTVGRDGTLVRLPAGSKAIEVDEAL